MLATAARTAHEAAHHKKVRPSEALCQTLNALNHAVKQNAIPVTLAAEFKLFDQAVTQLVTVAKADGRTTGYTYDDALRTERDEAKDALAHTREQFSADTLAHERKVAALEAEQRQLHTRIMELERDDSVLEVKKVVKEAEVQQRLTVNNEEEKNEIEEQSCCYKYILCCLVSGSVKKSKQAGAKLKEEQKKLMDSDPTATNTQTLDGLKLQKIKVDRELKETIAHPPQLNDEALSIRVGQAVAQIDDGEAKYYTEATRRLMFHLVRVNILYKSLTDKLADLKQDEPAPRAPDAKAPLLPPETPIKKIFEDNADKLDALTNSFWCATPEEHSLRYFNDVFDRLSGDERNGILSAASDTPALLDKVVPRDLPALTVRA